MKQPSKGERMTTKVAISGFGRIGRLVFRAMFDDPDLEVVAVNDLGKVETLAHLLKYDSIHGRYFDTVEAVSGDTIEANGHAFKVFGQRDPANLPWGDLGIDIVVDSTGFFTDGLKARAHLEAGARKVLITAPGKNVDNTIVMGVNHDTYNPETDHIVSNASCTTNCLAPFAKVLLDEFGIKRGLMNTIHSYTNDQRMLDGSHKDLRRARAGACNIIPTTTGAAKAVALVIPELAGKFDGFAVRVPTPDGSLVDLTVELERDVTADEVNAAMKKASEGSLRGILAYTEDPIVSSDVIGTEASSVFDGKLTMVVGGTGNLVKCVSWYDNEWGYSCRVKDLAKIM